MPKEPESKEEILDMMDSGVFDDDITLDGITTELKRRGKKKLCKNVGVTLLRFLDQKILERKKVNVDRKSVWAYRKANSIPDEPELIFDKGAKYDFYAAMNRIMAGAKTEVMIVDGYIDDGIFDLYVNKLPPGINVKILTDLTKPKGAFTKVAGKFKAQNPSFEARDSFDAHDRVLFIDSDAWVFGQSIHSAGNKPTYLIRVKKSLELRRVFDNVWSQSKKIM